MRRPLPPEIAAALDHAGVRAHGAVAITTLTSPRHRRAVYRIELVSGETIKARRLEDEATACALHDLRRRVPAAFVPVLARHGCVLLEPWIAGEELRDRSPSASILAVAGALLAALHAVTTAVGRSAREPATTAPWRARSERAFVELGRRGVLAAGTCERLHEILARLDPGTAAVGLVHTDFCGENMVVDGAGRLHVIDNERLSVDALGYDLGRTWSRWNLTDAQWARFAAAYAAGGGPPEAFAALDFWRLVATATAAATRLHLNAATPESFTRLRWLAAALA
jgi:hypothetical protein